MLDKVAIMNEARKKYRLEHDATVREQAKISFEQFKNEPLFVSGIMLYWAEGTRLSTADTNRKYQLALTNTDPELLEIYCNFLRNYFGDIELALRVGLYLHKDISEPEAKSFWAGRLEIPLEQFIKTQILPSRSTLTKTKLPYGVCCVYMNSKDYCWTMQVWIEEMSSLMRG